MMPFWKRRPRYAFPVENVRAVRAHIEGHGGVERIDMTLRIAGDEATVELTPDQARGLVIQLMAAYDALRPPLRRGGWGEGR